MDNSSSKKTWYWKQSQGKFLKILSDSQQGYIKVYNEKNELVLKKQNLTEEQVRLIEENFINIVVNFAQKNKEKPSSLFDSMVS
jgi:hypothetical protein